MNKIILCLVVVVSAVSVITKEVYSEEESANRPQGKGHGFHGKGQMPGFEPLPVSEDGAKAPVEDSRVYVAMPAAQKAILRKQMQQFLVSLTQMQGLMVDGKLDEVAKVADSMGRHQHGMGHGKGGNKGKGMGPGPGRYMPVPMRSLAWNMHEKAAELAETARSGDVESTYRSLYNLQTSCISCHLTYSTR